MRRRDPRRLASVVADLRRRRDDLAVGFYCPTCRALPGMPCREDGYPRVRPHRARRGR